MSGCTQPGVLGLQACKDAVTAHQKELGTPPPGVLNDECDPDAGSDCRVCCDHAKKCDCSPKPPMLAELLAAGGGGGYGL